MVITGFFLTGCIVAPAPQVPITGDPIIDGKARMTHGRPEDRNLWAYQTALEALRRGMDTEAAALLDTALPSLLSPVVGDPRAKAARGAFRPEAHKFFLGEPYEQAMAWFYRGILYWSQGDLDNARACFRSGQLADAQSVDPSFKSDFYLFDYLDAYLTEQKGDSAKTLYTRAESNKRGEGSPVARPDANVFLFFEFGVGPLKVPAGAYGDKVGIRPGSPSPQGVRIRVGNQSFTVPWMDDLTFQATTRGPRAMDRINDNKVVVKEATSGLGDAAIIAGAITAEDNETLGASLIVAGFLSKMVSEATRPEADVRSWRNLPNFLAFSAIRLAPGAHNLEATFLGPDGNPTSERKVELTLRIDSNQNQRVVFISDRTIDP